MNECDYVVAYLVDWKNDLEMKTGGEDDILSMTTSILWSRYDNDIFLKLNSINNANLVLAMAMGNALFNE